MKYSKWLVVASVFSAGAAFAGVQSAEDLGVLVGSSIACEVNRAAEFDNWLKAVQRSISKEELSAYIEGVQKARAAFDEAKSTDSILAHCWQVRTDLRNEGVL